MVLRVLSTPTRKKDVPSELRPVFERYPRAVELPDGARVTLRPLVPRDEEKLVQMFIGTPYEDLRNLQDNVTNPVIVRRWCRSINYDRVLPIVAELDGKIVGDATLHRRFVEPRHGIAEFRACVRGFMEPMCGIGKFRAYVRPEYRRRGLGAVLLKEILDLARTLGLKQLAVELYQNQVKLRKMLLRYGFRDEGFLPLYQRSILVRDVAGEDDERDEP
jgi:GNAT superfamily N-acetyltransferase